MTFADDTAIMAMGSTHEEAAEGIQVTDNIIFYGIEYILTRDNKQSVISHILSLV